MLDCSWDLLVSNWGWLENMMVRWESSWEMLGCMMEMLDCSLGLLGSSLVMWDCKMVKLGCMMEMLESSLDLLVNMMEMLESTVDLSEMFHMDCWGSSLDCWGWVVMVTWEHRLESWESSWDSLHHEQVMVCMETWQVILVTQAEVTKLGRSLDSYHWRHCLHWD